MDIVSLAPILLLGVAFYFLLIRPQRNRQKKHAVSAVAPGSEVMTTAGIFGTVNAVSEEELSLEIAPGTVIRILPAAISKVIPPTLPPMDDAE
jgi:preprotein translocase subunit YajC